MQEHIEACQYNQALERIWRQMLDPANQYLERTEPWKLVKTDKAAAKRVLYDLVEQLRGVAILLKPFLPRTAETIYTQLQFPAAVGRRPLRRRLGASAPGRGFAARCVVARGEGQAAIYAD